MPGECVDSLRRPHRAMSLMFAVELVSHTKVSVRKWAHGSNSSREGRQEPSRKYGRPGSLRPVHDGARRGVRCRPHGRAGHRRRRRGQRVGVVGAVCYFRQRHTVSTTKSCVNPGNGHGIRCRNHDRQHNRFTAHPQASATHELDGKTAMTVFATDQAKAHDRRLIEIWQELRQYDRGQLDHDAR